MAPKKRSSPDGEADATERATKVARTGKANVAYHKPKNRTKKAPAKAPLTPADFISKALPLHVNITHTPPSIMHEGDIDADGTEETTPQVIATSPTSIDDVGFIGNLTLVPNSFSTGSYGWKGSKRITVELQMGHVDEHGQREKVHVMLSINATVLGSKPAKSQNGKHEKGAEDVDEDADHPDDEQDAEVNDGEDKDLKA